jgi:hypothetical protein
LFRWGGKARINQPPQNNLKLKIMDKSQKPHLNKTDVKCRFFAQYWGQNVKTSEKHQKKGLKPLRIDAHSLQYVNSDSFLELKPLSKITDEDALAAIRIVKVYVRRDGSFITEHVPIDNIKNSFLDVPIWRLDLADFLRSKGYALPFMEYSVDELVELGWVRLV